MFGLKSTFSVSSESLSHAWSLSDCNDFVLLRFPFPRKSSSWHTSSKGCTCSFPLRRNYFCMSYSNSSQEALPSIALLFCPGSNSTTSVKASFYWILTFLSCDGEFKSAKKFIHHVPNELWPNVQIHSKHFHSRTIKQHSSHIFELLYSPNTGHTTHVCNMHMHIHDYKSAYAIPLLNVTACIVFSNTNSYIAYPILHKPIHSIPVFNSKTFKIFGYT